jgi:thiol-disulfide isomerase/thioredoxin
MMSRRTGLISGVGVVAALAGLGGALWRERQGVDAHAMVWALQFPTPDGGTLSMAEHRGRKVLINFWATWCPPCVRELPLLDHFQREQAGQGWRVIGLAVDGPTPVREFLRRTPLGFPVGLAGLDGTSLSRSLGNETGGLPFSVAFDAQGRLRERQLGELTDAELKRWAAALA